MTAPRRRWWALGLVVVSGCNLDAVMQRALGPVMESLGAGTTDPKVTMLPLGAVVRPYREGHQLVCQVHLEPDAGLAAQGLGAWWRRAWFLSWRGPGRMMVDQLEVRELTDVDVVRSSAEPHCTEALARLYAAEVPLLMVTRVVTGRARGRLLTELWERSGHHLPLGVHLDSYLGGLVAARAAGQED